MRKLLLPLFALAVILAPPAKAQDTVVVSFPGGEYSFEAEVQSTTPPFTCPPGWTCTPPDTIPPVIPPTPGAVGDTTNAIAWWFADPYSSTESFMADALGSLGGTAHEGHNWIYAQARIDRVSIDDSEGYGPLEKSARIDYTYDTHLCNRDLDGSGCNTQRSTWSLWGDNEIQEDGKPGPSGYYREVWLEFSYKLSANNYGCAYPQDWGEKFLPFEGHWPEEDPDFRGMWSNPKPPCAHKFAQFNPTGASEWGRWIVIPASGGAYGPQSKVSLGMGWSLNRRYTDDYDPDNDVDLHCSTFSPDATCWSKPLNLLFYDNTWHRFRLHLKPSTTETSFDGYFEVWVDDEKIVDSRESGIEINTEEYGGPDSGAWLSRFALGANKDKGGTFPHTEWTKHSHAIVWVEKPSWYGGD